MYAANLIHNYIKSCYTRTLVKTLFKTWLFVHNSYTKTLEKLAFKFFARVVQWFFAQLFEFSVFIPLVTLELMSVSVNIRFVIVKCRILHCM